MPDEVSTSKPRCGNDDVWIVVTAFNEGRRLEPTLRQLCHEYPNIVVVDDGSSDETREIAMRFPIWVLEHSINCGQGAALRTGIDFALQQGAAIIVNFDGDGQHCVDEIGRLVAPIRAGQVEVALGSRFLGQTEDMPRHRWVILKLGVVFTRLFSWIDVTDTHNGFRAFARHAAQTVRITQNRMAHSSEILDEIARHGLTYCEVPVTIRYTEDTLTKGQSSWNGLRIVAQMILGRLIK
jgi:glycosyltransferase involved in cell wall biosynthesis